MSLNPQSTVDLKVLNPAGNNSQVLSFRSQRHVSQVACDTCHMHDKCMPGGLNFDEAHQLNSLIGVRKRIKRGAALYRSGEEFMALYIIRTGFFKTVVTADDGHDQVTGFQMAGEALGLDGIHTNHHTCHAIALEDAEVCVVPFMKLEGLAHDTPSFQRKLYRMMSREIVREHEVMLLLGSMRADARLAAFLMDLVQRLHTRGYSSQELVLRMTREEIGSYLGLKLETVSRTFSKFVEEGLVEVKQRYVRILNADGLKLIVNNPHCH